MSTIVGLDRLAALLSNDRASTPLELRYGTCTAINPATNRLTIRLAGTSTDLTDIPQLTAGPAPAVGDLVALIRHDDDLLALGIPTDPAHPPDPPGGGTGSGGAPTTAGYLVTAADPTLTAETVVGATPGGELGGTWASPTVDTTHAGSSHATTQAAAEATAAAGLAAHAAATDPHTVYQRELERDKPAGYPGLDSGLGILPNQLPAGRFSPHQQAMNAWLSRTGSAVITEVWVGDSMTSVGGTSPEQNSCAAIYENEIVEAHNVAPRSAGFVPVRQYNTATNGDVGIGWDTVNGTNGTRGTTRGPNFTNRKIQAAEFCETTRDADTGVTIYYTAQAAGGAKANVKINGTLAGVIDSRDATITDPSGFDSGRSVFFARIPTTTLGPATVRVEHEGTGTDFELEGAYFHARNSISGYRLLRADKSGQQLAALNAAATPFLLQFIRNTAPKIITIMCGVNDANPAAGNKTAAQTATELTNLATAIRALAPYSTEKPTIRYVFQNGSVFVPATWETDYRAALRQACTDQDIYWIDGADSNGPLDGTPADPHDLSDDTLHPNDRGHWIWGQLVAHHTLGARASRAREVLDVSAFRQRITGILGVLTWMNANGSQLYLFREPAAAAVSSGALLGALGFGGSIDPYSQGKVSAAIRAIAEQAWTASPTNWPARLEFMTTPASSTALTVRGGFDKDGHFWIGASAAAPVAKIDQSSGALSLTPNVVYTDRAAASYYDISASFAGLGIIALKGSTGPSLYLGRDEASATDTADVLANLGFAGADDAAGTMRLSAAIRAKATAGFDATHRESDLEFMTTAGTTLAVRAGISNTGDLYVGASLASAVASIDASGNATFASLAGLSSVTATNIYGASTASGTLTLNSTSNATKGEIRAADPFVAGTGTPAGAIASGAAGTAVEVFAYTGTATNDDPRVRYSVARAVVTGNAATTTVNAPATVSNGASFQVRARVIAKQSGGTNTRSFELLASFNQSAGTVTQIGATSTVHNVATATAPALPAFGTTNTSQVNLAFTGPTAGVTYIFHVIYEVIELNS